jgi:adenosylmethionine-8-amino-7-oxononanoate aminotransferase
MSRERESRFNFTPGTTPFTISGGEGVYLHTSDGRKILDGAGGAIVANIGYGRPEIAEAAAAALEGAAYVVPPWPTENRIRLVERILDRWVPAELTRCFLVSGGSESVDTAMRIARHYQVAKGQTGRWRVAGRTTSYHGATIATVAVGNHDARRAPFGPLLADHPKIDSLSADAALKDLEAADPSTISAVILEPIIGSSGGALMSDDDYWPRIREFCTDHDILLISDEVMTGYGRTGKKMAVEHLGVTPDILVAGKGLGGGYAAIGAVVARESVVDAIAAANDSVMFFTSSGMEVSVAIADRVLQILEAEDLVSRSAQMGAVLKDRLQDEFADHPNVADIRGRGLLVGMELVKDRSAGTSFNGALIKELPNELLSRDCWIYQGGSAHYPDNLLFGPAFVINESEIDQLVAIARAALDAAVAKLSP